jgi:hypothetical protein
MRGRAVEIPVLLNENQLYDWIAGKRRNLPFSLVYLEQDIGCPAVFNGRVHPIGQIISTQGATYTSFSRDTNM